MQNKNIVMKWSKDAWSKRHSEIQNENYTLKMVKETKQLKRKE